MSDYRKHSTVTFINQDADLFDTTGKLMISCDIYISTEVTEIFCEEMVSPIILANILLANKHFRKQEMVDRPIRVFIGDTGEIGRATLIEETDFNSGRNITGRNLMTTFNNRTDHIGPCSAAEMIKVIKAYTDNEDIPHSNVIRKKLIKRIGLRYVKTIDIF